MIASEFQPNLRQCFLDLVYDTNLKTLYSEIRLNLSKLYIFRNAFKFQTFIFALLEQF